MKENTLNRFKGKFCKIVTRETDEEKAHAVVGIVKEIDHYEGLMLINSKRGTYVLNTDTIIAIKPTTRRRFAQ